MSNRKNISLAKVKKMVEELQELHSRMSGELPLVDKKVGDLISVNIAIKDFSFWNKSSQNFPLLAQTLLNLMEDNEKNFKIISQAMQHGNAALNNKQDKDNAFHQIMSLLSSLHYND